MHIVSVPSLSGHAIAYRGRSLPRVRRHGASKSQDSSERMLPWQVTIDQLTFASLSHTHYWYEVGMLKVPAVMIPPKRFDIFPPDNRGCSEGLDGFGFFFFEIPHSIVFSYIYRAMCFVTMRSTTGR